MVEGRGNGAVAGTALVLTVRVDGGSGSGEWICCRVRNKPRWV